ncbi:ATP-binding protein [Streptomyces acidiscabies]|uniref:ATP-binding protein n=1 Tax=Streptomyces acidiscabies TaxID=42234 RepID=UPI0038F71F4E
MSTVPNPDTWTYSLRLPHDPRAARVARMTVRAALTAHAMLELLDPVELLTSELVTNTYRHTTGPASVRLTAPGNGGLRVGIWDTHPHIPEPFAHPTAGRPPMPPANKEGGRGLCLVQAYAYAWGGWPLQGDPGSPGTGKLLWFEVRPTTLTA